MLNFLLFTAIGNYGVAHSSGGSQWFFEPFAACFGLEGFNDLAHGAKSFGFYAPYQETGSKRLTVGCSAKC
jgi:hypothetical protein